VSKRFGRYDIVERISFGGMAEVCIGKSSGMEGFQKVLAIKRMLPSLTDDKDFVTMFIDEAKISAQLTHHNIGQIFEFGKCEDQYFIAMEYIQGLDLGTVHKHFHTDGKSMPVNVVLRVIQDACSGLNFAHHKEDMAGNPMNIVHRDISPQNLLISYDGIVKIIDFGIAKALDRATKTQGGQLKGKFSYMSPEHAEGGKVDGRADVFALGILMFETLTSQPLFQGNTAIHTLQKVIKAYVPPLKNLNPEVDEDLEAIIRKALARDPNDRYQTAEELQIAIFEYVVKTKQPFTNMQLSMWMKETFAEEFKEANERLSRAISAPPAPEPEPTPEVEPQEDKQTPADAVEEDEDILTSAPPLAEPAPEGMTEERFTRLAPDLLEELEAQKAAADEEVAPAEEEPQAEEDSPFEEAEPTEEEAPPEEPEPPEEVEPPEEMEPAEEAAPPEPDPPPEQVPDLDAAALVADMMPAVTDEEEATVLDTDYNASMLADLMAAKKTGEEEEPPEKDPPVEEPPGKAEKLEEPPPVAPPPAAPTPAPAEAPAPAPKEAGGSGKLKALIIVVILLLGAGGAAAYWFLAGSGQNGGDAEKDTSRPPTKEEPPPPPAKEEPPPPPPKEAARPAKKHRAAASRPSRSRKPGYLIVVAAKPSRIFVDGKDTGRKTPVAPSNPLTLSPGRHKVRLVSGDKSSEHRVVIRTGKTSKLINR